MIRCLEEFCSKAWFEGRRYSLTILLIGHCVVRAEEKFPIEQLYGNYGEDELE